MGHTGPSDAWDQVPWGHSCHGLDLSLSGTFMCLLACSDWAHVKRRCVVQSHSTMQFRNTGHLHVTSVIRNAEKAWGQVRKQCWLKCVSSWPSCVILVTKGTTGFADADVPRRPDCFHGHIPQIWLTAASGCLHWLRMSLTRVLAQGWTLSLCSLDSPGTYWMALTESHQVSSRMAWTCGEAVAQGTHCCRGSEADSSDTRGPGPPSALLSGSVCGRCPQRECGTKLWGSAPAGCDGNGCVRVALTFIVTIGAAAAGSPSQMLRPQGDMAKALLAPASCPCPMNFPVHSPDLLPSSGISRFGRTEVF